jgi:hypothetical protein
MVAADLRPLGGGRYGKRGKAAVHPDEPARVIVEARLVAALQVNPGVRTLRLMYHREP